MQTFHVRIDRLTQGADGQEHVVDRLIVDHEDSLWVYVEASLPGGAVPEGNYCEIRNNIPDSKSRLRLDAPDKVGDFYRFSLRNHILSPATRYAFHFADRVDAPAFGDTWEVVTLTVAPGLVRAGSLKDESVHSALRFALAMERVAAPRPRFSATAPAPGPVSTSPPTSPASPVTLAAVPKYWTNACNGMDVYQNNCAHYLSDAMLRTGFTQLNPPSDCINARCNTARKRPIRARDMWCWFKSMATTTSTTPTRGTGMWAVFQLDESEYWGGHVVLLDSDTWKYYGTGWYDHWDQHLYRW
jgi:hypothetical protein